MPPCRGWTSPSCSTSYLNGSGTCSRSIPPPSCCWTPTPASSSRQRPRAWRRRCAAVSASGSDAASPAGWRRHGRRSRSTTSRLTTWSIPSCSPRAYVPCWACPCSPTATSSAYCTSAPWPCGGSTPTTCGCCSSSPIVPASQVRPERRSSTGRQRWPCNAACYPAGYPTIPGLDLAARYVPGHDLGIGGDWYDVFMLPSGWLGAVIGDVSGHGLPSAVVMGRIRSALRAYALDCRRSRRGADLPRPQDPPLRGRHPHHRRLRPHRTRPRDSAPLLAQAICHRCWLSPANPPSSSTWRWTGHSAWADH